MRNAPRRIALGILMAVLHMPSVATAVSSRPSPYSLPWQLRPAAASTAIRIEATTAFYEEPSLGQSGQTWVASFTGSWKLSPHWAPVVRVCGVSNDPPAPQKAGTALSNPVLGMTYVLAKGDTRRAGFIGFALPLGQGGGASPDPGAAAAIARGIPARSSMDNALFATNYFTVIAGATLAYVTPAVTAQSELTLLRLFRARGPSTGDAARTNSTLALHLGHCFTSRLSVGADLRYQRWLTDAAPVRANAAARENVTFAMGPRFHFKLGESRAVRPGIAWAHATDRPFATAGYDMIQVDVPITF